MNKSLFLFELLSHLDWKATENEIISRCLELFARNSVIVAKEPHTRGGYHFHAFL